MRGYIDIGSFTGGEREREREIETYFICMYK